MTVHPSRLQFARAETLNLSAPARLRIRKTGSCADTPISHQALSWLLFWPLLSLIARHVVYFSGPAPTAAAYQNAAFWVSNGSHYYLYVNVLFMLGFVLAGYQQVWSTLQRNPLILATLALAVCSAAWSTSPRITLQMCVSVGICTLFACYLSARFTTDRLMQLLIFMGTLAIPLNIVFALALPAYGIFQGYGGNAWQGICDHKNTLGLSMAFLLTPVFFTDTYSHRRKLVYSAMLLFLIYKSQSRGAWLDTAGMLAFVAWLSLVRRVRSREYAPILLITVTAGLAAIVVGVHFWPALATSMGKDPTMSGRTGIYAEVWRSIMIHPLSGYGFGNFWTTPEARRIGLALGWPNIGYAENGFLELALQTGLLGAGLVFIMIAKGVAQGIRLLRSPNYSPRVGWFLTILFLVLLTNIDAGWLMTVNTLDWVLILISCIGMNEEIHSA